MGFRGCTPVVVVMGDKGGTECLSKEMGAFCFNIPFNFSCSSSKSTWVLGASTASAVTPETILDLERWRGFVIDFNEDWELKADEFRPRREIPEEVDGRV